MKRTTIKYTDIEYYDWVHEYPDVDYDRVDRLALIPENEVDIDELTTKRELNVTQFEHPEIITTSTAVVTEARAELLSTSSTHETLLVEEESTQPTPPREEQNKFNCVVRSPFPSHVQVLTLFFFATLFISMLLGLLTLWRLKANKRRFDLLRISTADCSGSYMHTETRELFPNIERRQNVCTRRETITEAVGCPPWLAVVLRTMAVLQNSRVLWLPGSASRPESGYLSNRSSRHTENLNYPQRHSIYSTVESEREIMV